MIMRERLERAESPCAHVTELVSRDHFCLALCSFQTALTSFGVYHQERGAIPLHDAVGIK